MPSLGGITEIIGVRAVIIDVRQYLADGREIERVNERIALASKKVETASTAAATSQKANFAAQKKAYADQQAASAARLKAIQLEIQAEDARANLAAASRTRPQGPNGQFIGAAAAQDIKDQSEAVIKAQRDAEGLRLLTARTAVQSSKAAAEAGAVETADIQRRNAALAEEARLKALVADATRSRIRAAASGVALVGVAAIGVTAAAAITSAAKYQQELSKINVLTSATDAETQQLGQSFLKLSTEIPVSASDLAAAAYKLLSSGIKDTGQALEITTNAAKAATAGQADIKDIISATISVLNGYPKGAITATQVNDILFAGVKEGAAEFNDFAGAIGKVIPIAAALGVPFDQLTAAMAVLTNGGLNAEEAMTGLRAILNDLAKDEGSKQAQDALASVGLTVEQLRRNIAEKGLPQAMGELLTLFKGNLAAIEPIIPNIRGMVAAYSAFSNGGKTTIGVLANIDKSVGIVDQSFEKVKNNTANVAKLFSNTLNVALIEIGNAILPSVTKALQDLVTWVQANREGIQQFVSQGLQGIINIGRDAARGIETIVNILGALSGVLKTLIGQSATTQVALAAIGAGLAWALPGGPLIVGLTSVLLLLGQIQNAAGGGSNGSTGRAIVQGVSTAIGAVGGGLLGAASFTPFGVGAGAIGGGALGSIGGKALSDLLFGPEQNANLDKTNELLSRINDDTHTLGNQTLPNLQVNIGGVDQAAKKAAQDLKKLAEDFQKTSEAAGQVKSLTEEFGKFGTITKQLADANKLSATQAGQIQAVDAVIRAQERANAEAFNYIEAVTAITQAWRQNAAVGKELALELAQASLEASQKALSDVFSRPTREVANLNVNLARQQLNTSQITQRNSPQINALKQQLEAINRQISQTNRNNSLANREAQRQQRAQQAAQKSAQDAQKSQLEALQLANLIAQIAAERQQAQMQKLIDANNKAASDLQETFLKNNEALQLQINTAIGKGDTATALGLVDQQRAATKQYRDQSKALQKNTQDLTTQQKAAQEAEAERQRQAKLAEALLQSQQKQQDSTDNLTDSLDSAKEAQDAQTEALNNSKDAIQAQIDALQAPIDASQEQEKTIQDNIAVFEAQTNVLKALGVAADHTLLTQDQQRQAAEHFTTQISIASGYAQTLAKSFYDFIPGAKDADLKFQTLNGVMDVMSGKINLDINPAFDALKARLDLQKLATEDVTNAFNNSTTQTNQTAQNIKQAMSDWQTEQEKILVAEANARDTFTKKISTSNGLLDQALSSLIKTLSGGARSVGGGLIQGFTSLFHAQGGYYNKPTLGVFGEAGPEVILPLNNPQRSREIMTQVPPSIMASMMNSRSGQAIFAPSITVTGETLETMEVTAINAVRSAFRDARAISSRSGGLITQGIGPGR